ncbi:hypothetical protein YQE_10674, partial [Dendroctonus ponderosae]
MQQSQADQPVAANMLHYGSSAPTDDSFEDFPLIKLGSSNEDNYETTNVNEREKDESIAPFKLAGDKPREDNSRAIEFNSSQLWASDFHDKIDVLAPKLPARDNSFEVSDLPENVEKTPETTPSIAKVSEPTFKETIDSVDQELDNFEKDEDDDDDTEAVDVNLSVEHLQKHPSEPSTVEYENDKGIVNNETVDTNIVHKNISIEHTRTLQVDLESSFTDTKGEGNGDTINATTVLPLPTTRKSFHLKDVVIEKSNTPVLNNNIETEIGDSVKDTSTTTPSNTILKFKGEANEKKVRKVITTTSREFQDRKTTDIVRRESQTTTPNISATTNVLSSINSNISDQENIIPHVSSSTKSTSSEDIRTVTESINALQNRLRSIIDDGDKVTTGTTTAISTSEAEVITDTTIINTVSSDASTAENLQEGTTSFVIENDTEPSDFTTEYFATTTVIPVGESTSENTVRTSKGFEFLETTTETGKGLETTTEIYVEHVKSTIKNELDSTKLNNGTSIEKLGGSDQLEVTIRTIEAVAESTNPAMSEKTTINVNSVDEEASTQESTLAGVTESKANTIAASENPATNTVSAEPTSATTRTTDQSTPATTEYKFIHIEDSGNMHTTLLPEVLNPNFNYSTSKSPDEEISARNVPINPATEVSSSPSTTLSDANGEPVTVDSTTEDSAGIVPTDSGYIKEDEDGNYKGKVAAIALSCVGAVCLIVLAGLLYVMKKRQKRLNYGPRCRPVSLDDYSIDNLSVYSSVRRKGGARQSKRSFGNPAFEDPVAPTHPLNFTALAKFSANLEDIRAEYEDIPQITARNSELPDGCDTKNRYSNVIPLPETRVFLTPIDGYPNSDYINANYVTGPSNIKGYYIATQGPMQNTVDDFWRMVWEQQTKVILMLTHLVENGLPKVAEVLYLFKLQEKCADYLPESEVLDCSRVFGDFQITLKKREVKEKYIISSLQLKNMVSNSWRDVTHFWYLGWPEKGVPSEANSLIAFLIEARSYMKAVTTDNKNGLNGIHNATQNEHNPVVVHCSPGTGRTGVAMASDIAIREFETTRLVDIPKIVYRIRRDRANAIQTKEQYIFVYKVVSLYATKLTGGAMENL